MPVEKGNNMFELLIPEHKVAAFPQLFAQVRVSRPVLDSPLLGTGRASRARWATLGRHSHVHRILPVDQWIELDRHLCYLGMQASIHWLVIKIRVEKQGQSNIYRATEISIHMVQKTRPMRDFNISLPHSEIPGRQI